MPATTPTPALTPSSFQEAAMLDTETGEPKKTIERKKHP